MAKLHHKVLKAAVAKYGGANAEGKDEQALKAEIAADDKKFDEDGIAEIYAAIAAPAADKPEPKKEVITGHVVKATFRDKDDFSKAYHPGHDVSHFEQDRLDHLVKHGLVEAVKGEE